MKFVGAHISYIGIDNAVINANKINATAFSLFTKNQRRWHAPPLKKDTIKKFKKNCEIFGYKNNQIVSHASYLINLGHPNIEKLKQSRISFIDEILRCEQLGINLINFHPGSHINEIQPEKCLNIISESINFALDKTKNIIAVIENTAGQGTNLGFKFEHLSYIINNIEDKTRIGVCFDTAHAFASGYDLRTLDSCNDTFDKFDKIVGLKYLKIMHLNDSKSSFNSHVDRHQSIGIGEMGYLPFRYIMKDKRFDNIPLILETINSNIWYKEIIWLKKHQ